MPEETKAEKKEAKREARLVEVPTAYGVAVELEDGSQVNEIQLLVLIYNKLLKIEKSVA